MIDVSIAKLHMTVGTHELKMGDPQAARHNFQRAMDFMATSAERFGNSTLITPILLLAESWAELGHKQTAYNLYARAYATASLSSSSSAHLSTPTYTTITSSPPPPTPPPLSPPSSSGLDDQDEEPSRTVSVSSAAAFKISTSSSSSSSAGAEATAAAAEPSSTATSYAKWNVAQGARADVYQNLMRTLVSRSFTYLKFGDYVEAQSDLLVAQDLLESAPHAMDKSLQARVANGLKVARAGIEKHRDQGGCFVVVVFLVNSLFRIFNFVYFSF